MSGVATAYGVPVSLFLVAVCLNAYFDWRYKSPRALDPYSRSIEDEDESEWHTKRYGR